MTSPLCAGEGGSRRFRRVLEDSGRCRRVLEGSARFRKVAVQGEVQVPGASSGGFGKVPEGSSARVRVRCRLQAQVPDGSGWFRMVSNGSGGGHRSR